MKSVNQRKGEEPYRGLPVSICTSILKEMIERSVIESESSQFYRQEIEKCQEYISLIQTEATRTWEAPAKPEDFQVIEDVEFFQSEFTLKNKLNIIQDLRQVEERRRLSHHSRNNSIRASVKTRKSSMSGFSWSEQKYKSFKQQNQQKLKEKRVYKQLSLQKLAPSNKHLEVSSTQKHLKEVYLLEKSRVEPQSKKKTHRQIFRKKEKPLNEEDEKIPMLIELAYCIKSTEHKNHKGTSPGRKVQVKDRPQLLQNKPKPTLKLGNRLKISEYDPNANQIKVSNWRRFNDLIEEPKSTELSSNEAHPSLNQFKDIAYYCGDYSS